MPYQRLVATLIEARKNAGLTQQDLANRLNRPKHFVSRYETEAARLDIIDFVDVANALALDPLAELGRAFLIGDDD